MKYILCATCENGQLQMISSRNSPDIFQISYVEKSWELCKQSRATVGVCTVYLAQYQELQGRILGSPRNKKQWKDDTHAQFSWGTLGKFLVKDPLSWSSTFIFTSTWRQFVVQSAEITKHTVINKL